MPTLTGSVQFYYQGQQNAFTYFNSGNDKFFKVGFVGLSLSVPIFDGFEKHSKSQQYTIELLQLQNTMKDESNRYARDFIVASHQYTTSLNALVRQHENIVLAEQDYQISLQGYRSFAFFTTRKSATSSKRETQRLVFSLV